MRVRVLLAAVALALTCVPLAWSSSAASTYCGTVEGGGAKWSVVTTHVACSSAKSLVKTLAAKPRTGVATRLGTHMGLKCIEYAGNGKREIACVTKTSSRTVFGVSPPKK
jgi:hypothetical protein